MEKTYPKFPHLDVGGLDPDPIKQFSHWYDAAWAAGIKLPDAMTLATATGNGKPSARIVLLKNVDQGGFVFYTNYDSRKGAELSDNPRAALVFYWTELDRSVRIEGRVSKISAEESDAYFATRPRESRLSSLASAQSRVLSNREELDRRFEELRKQFDGRPIPRPEQWGGYRLEPDAIEFWQQRYARLNDRILYERQPDGSWTMRRLAP